VTPRAGIKNGLIKTMPQIYAVAQHNNGKNKQKYV
jgi:hypothetical protein